MKDGAKSGKWTSYYSNGKVATLGEYKNNRKIGQWRYYSKKGRLNSVKNFE